MHLFLWHFVLIHAHKYINTFLVRIATSRTSTDSFPPSVTSSYWFMVMELMFSLQFFCWGGTSYTRLRGRVFSNAYYYTQRYKNIAYSMWWIYIFRINRRLWNKSKVNIVVVNEYETSWLERWVALSGSSLNSEIPWTSSYSGATLQIGSIPNTRTNHSGPGFVTRVLALIWFYLKQMVSDLWTYVRVVCAIKIRRK